MLTEMTRSVYRFSIHRFKYVYSELYYIEILLRVAWNTLTLVLLCNQTLYVYWASTFVFQQNTCNKLSVVHIFRSFKKKTYLTKPLWFSEMKRVKLTPKDTNSQNTNFLTFCLIGVRFLYFNSSKKFLSGVVKQICCPLVVSEI